MYEQSFEIRRFRVFPCLEEAGSSASKVAELAWEGKLKDRLQGWGLDVYARLGLHPKNETRS